MEDKVGRSPTANVANHYDIAKAIMETREELQIRMSTAHVKGHQDRGKAKRKGLSRQAQFNIMADAIANRATQMTRGTPDQDVMITLPTAKIYIIDTSGPEQRVITGQERRTLLYRHLSRQYYEYLQQRWQWSHETMAAIAWTSREQAIKSLTPAMQIFVTKGSIGWLATNHKLHQWKETTVNTCPKCREVETNDHLWMCHKRKTYRDEVLGHLRT